MDTLKWKRWIAGYLNVAKVKKRKLVLIYHSVGDGPEALSLDKFREQMYWVAHTCKVQSLSRILQSEPVLNTQIAITFDDGYHSLYEVVLPVFKELEFTATVYLNTGWISVNESDRKLSDADLGHYKNESFLTWGEVNELRANGWEIGSHGVNHLEHGMLGKDQMQSELRESKEAIEQECQIECKYFAYTWGRHTEKLRQAVSDAKYESAVAAHHAPLSSKDNLYALPRINIDRNYSLEDFINIINGKWDFMRLIHKIKSIL